MRRWHALVRDGRTRMAERSTVIEGAHLFAAYLDSGARPRAVLVSESGQARAEIAALVERSGITPVTLSDALFRWLADAATPAGLAAEIGIPAQASLPALAGDCVFMERIQDAGNVGAILRSAAAFGLRHAVLSRGCADPWSPKVLRAAMGGHFSLAVTEVETLRPWLSGRRYTAAQPARRRNCTGTSAGSSAPKGRASAQPLPRWPRCAPRSRSRRAPNP
jgi:TrmH family RNA methyltransferase